MNWSLPDQDGIVTYQLSVGAVSTLRGRRKRKGITPRFFDLDLWPDSWKKVLSLWVKQVGNRRKWMSMLKAAGQRYVNEAGSVVEALLKAGLIEVEERRDKGSWQLQWIEFLDLEKVREQLGLPNREHLEVVKNAQSNCLVECPELEGLKDSLVTMPAERAIRRHELVIALDRWVAEECNGTRRDFAYFARGDTKALTDSEWSWLENHVSLEHLGISRHVPAVWLRAPITLFFNGGRLDLRAIQDFIGLTPNAFVQLNAIEGEVRCWRILENRTVFEKIAAQHGATDGVVWVPGFAPSWWKASVQQLLAQCPATGVIACDPDPAGIEIALDVGQIWSSCNLSWEPWNMDSATLMALPKRKLLTEGDRARLNRLLPQKLPRLLQELADWMDEHGEKGEQEGVFF